MTLATIALVLIAATYAFVALRHLTFHLMPDSTVAEWLGTEDPFLDRLIDGSTEDNMARRS